MRSIRLSIPVLVVAVLASLALPLPSAAAEPVVAPAASVACAPAAMAAAAALGLDAQQPIAESACPAFCSSHEDCEFACPSVPGVYCDFSTWTCEGQSGGGDPGNGGQSCPAFCTSHGDCEDACPEVIGVYCDFSTWTCAV